MSQYEDQDTPEYQDHEERYTDQDDNSETDQREREDEHRQRPTEEKHSVKLASAKLRELANRYFPEFCIKSSTTGAGSTDNPWFDTRAVNASKLVNFGEEDTNRFDNCSWWGSPKKLNLEPTGREIFDDRNLKMLKKGTYTQIFSPPNLNIIEFKDNDFMTPKAVMESTEPPQLFNTPSLKFKDSSFSKVGHLFMNNARISCEIYTLMSYLTIINSPAGKERLSAEEFKDMSDAICHLIEMVSEAAYFSASAGYSLLKLEARKEQLANLDAETWIKDDLLGSSFNCKTLFGPIPKDHMDYVNKNPNLRIKMKKVPQPTSGKGRGGNSRGRGGWQQNQFNLGRSFPQDKLFFRPNLYRGGRGNSRGRGSQGFRGRNTSGGFRRNNNANNNYNSNTNNNSGGTQDKSRNNQ